MVNVSQSGSATLLTALYLQLLLFSIAFGSKTVVITGANRGIGLAATTQLLSSGDWNVVMACRSVERATTAIKKATGSATIPANCEILPLDLADLSSIRSFAKSLGGRKIDCLALNAGIQVGDIKEPIRTADGFEETVGVNHMGHFLLLNMLLPTLKKVHNSRVVITASGVHNPDEAGGNVGSKATLGSLGGLISGFREPLSMVDGGKFDPDKAYKDSKLCNVLTTLELDRRLRNEKSTVTANCFNPGLIPTTGLFREFNPLFVIVFTFFTRYVFKVAASEEEGGSRLAYLVSSANLDNVSGKYYSAGKPGLEDFKPINVSKEAQDSEKAAKLWQLTAKLVGL